MFIAVDSNKNRVAIENATKDIQYFCPCCGEPLIIRAKDSVAVKAHFAHKKGTDCDSFTHDMSEWHLNWQKQFPEESREVVVEKDGEKHRADVLIKNTVIEFQHSPITADEIARRNRFYLSCGYEVVWVFDADGQVKNPYGNSIDPAIEHYLCWKRAKQQFSITMDKRVSVFIQYKTPISSKELNGKPVDIMLLLNRVDPKDIDCYRTQIGNIYYYFQPINFIKQFCDSVNESVFSVGTIIHAVDEYQKRVKYQGQNQVRYISIPVHRRRGRL